MSNHDKINSQSIDTNTASNPSDTNTINTIANSKHPELPELCPAWQDVVVSYEDIMAYFNNVNESAKSKTLNDEATEDRKEIE